MKLQELNAQEMREINGGLLGLGGDSSSTGGITGALGLNFSNESKDEDGSWEKTSFGLGLDLGAILNSITE
ncbi:hypothetical protein SAMN04487996_108146 [Dyadobacter soli]|uniref:Bacteriocin-type signal sequence-containing protein n=1 Tax=Dyadobacter soli TaxID=659014 RepID=A0A1G7HG34_9BACT|nr:hypothetical protein [Dyadobacter soli]SDE99273.1 hypothetical protein SAMN04487996_108146 [Dyadobacter soli]